MMIFFEHEHCNPNFFFDNKADCENQAEICKIIRNNYSTEIYPEGKKLVDSEILHIRNITGDDAKIDAILMWEYHNKSWLNPQWDQMQNNYYSLDSRDSFVIYNNDYTRLRAIPNEGNCANSQKNPYGYYYYDDPYWITYNKVGACNELAVLFSFMANNVGIESSVVQSDFLIWNHRWAEVNISGRLMYVDPWCAGQYNLTHELNFDEKWRWHNTTNNFAENCWFYASIGPTYKPDLLDPYNISKMDLSPMYRYNILMGR